MNNGKPHIREILTSLHQITGTPWRGVHDQATICLAFNTDLTDHAVHPTEKSMWPVRTRFMAPVAHDQDGNHRTWWDKVKHLWHAAERYVKEGIDYVDHHKVRSLEIAGMVLFAVTPVGWFVEGMTVGAAGVSVLVETATAIRSAQIGETLMEESNLFYALKGTMQGAKQIGTGLLQTLPQGYGMGLVWAGNWDANEGVPFDEHLYNTATGTIKDLGTAIAWNRVGYGTKEMALGESEKAFLMRPVERQHSPACQQVP
ncbi:hypothetical protein [Piscirickettsia litoralis]|uniref:Uncharacterized protein n=1 Tax=Piscirickettsia litoralis TaxID=1891921 RepID=A0ABX3A496_9GAMM|nr:hypothetical protein [Piscirickettsia litoralis]ODN43684.1 hypothetical protein BGC07_13205 [Piscirickettsia litoralis]